VKIVKIINPRVCRGGGEEEKAVLWRWSVLGGIGGAPGDSGGVTARGEMGWIRVGVNEGFLSFSSLWITTVSSSSSSLILSLESESSVS